jgi:hypothetical protein
MKAGLLKVQITDEVGDRVIVSVDLGPGKQPMALNVPKSALVESETKENPVAPKEKVKSA